MDEFTFGRTPAAMYLARRLTELDDRFLTRACTVRTRQFNENLKEILDIPNNKVVANLLRLLREEASKIELLKDGQPDKEYSFVAQLLRNTIIGKIKSGIRKASFARRIETRACDINKTLRSGFKGIPTEHFFVVMEGNLPIAVIDRNRQFQFLGVELANLEDGISPELLHQRSLRRCVRQGKPHAVGAA